MSPGEAGERGFRDRIVSDATMTGLLGAGTRVLPGFAVDTLTKDDCPRITYFVPVQSVRRPGLEVVRIQTDAWIWPTGAAGGRMKALAVDAQLLALFDEQQWMYGGRQIYSLALPGSDFPAPPDAPMRRRRDFELRIG